MVIMIKQEMGIQQIMANMIKINTMNIVMIKRFQQVEIIISMMQEAKMMKMMKRVLKIYL